MARYEIIWEWQVNDMTCEFCEEHHDIHDCWQWDLKDTDLVAHDISEGYEVELIKSWGNDDEGCVDREYFDIHPKDDSHLLPKYIQKYVAKIRRKKCVPTE